MFDADRPGSIFAGAWPPADVAASPAGPTRVPLERLEAQICELAGHLAAATCRFLVLLADFDARRGWASWEMTSCAAWLLRNSPSGTSLRNQAETIWTGSS